MQLPCQKLPRKLNEKSNICWTPSLFLWIARVVLAHGIAVIKIFIHKHAEMSFFYVVFCVFNQKDWWNVNSKLSFRILYWKNSIGDVTSCVDISTNLRERRSVYSVPSSAPVSYTHLDVYKRQE